MNAFVAFKASEDDDYREDIISQLTPILSPLGFVPVDSGDAYYRHIADCQGFKEWIEFIIRTIDPDTDEPLYPLMICVDHILGKASAALVEGFLHKNKPVIYYDGTKEFSAIIGVSVLDEDNWKGGWKIILDRQMSSD